MGSGSQGPHSSLDSRSCWAGRSQGGPWSCGQGRCFKPGPQVGAPDPTLPSCPWQLSPGEKRAAGADCTSTVPWTGADGEMGT